MDVVLVLHAFDSSIREAEQVNLCELEARLVPDFIAERNKQADGLTCPIFFFSRRKWRWGIPLSFQMAPLKH